ncbi:hypothetical protein CI610_00126 [invertebrate metagenome]|uniref:EcsC family protein n=1 Tax=invertebrate metagenome TaxID=1711999 RepID=A0A2H9TCP2_9ZZZZ
MFKQQLNHTVLRKTLEWSYTLAIKGFRGFCSAEELARQYSCLPCSVEKRVDYLIRRQHVNAGISGLITGIGGVLSVPVGIPANVACVLLLQVRMVAAIACIQHKDLSEQGTKSLIFACLAGKNTKNLLSELGINGSLLLLGYTFRRMPDKWVNILFRRISSVLLVNVGTTGAFRLVRLLPLAGSVVGGALDALSTNTIGQVAKEVFSPADFVQKKATKELFFYQ